MQRLGSPWSVQGLLPRLPPQSQVRTLIYKSPGQIERNRRYKRKVQAKSPTKRSSPLYEIPYVVLDLDAEDNPRVRSYTDQDEKDQTARWSHNPKVDALSDRLHIFRHELRQSDKLWKAPLGPFDQRRLSDRDLLSVAFLGASSRGKDAPTGSHNLDTPVDQGSLGNTTELLASNGIPQRILEDDIKTVNFMFHWQELHEPQLANNEDIGKLKSELSRLSLHQLRRVAAQLLQTDAGSRLLSLCGDEVYFSLVDAGQQRHGLQLRVGNDPTEVLVFLNNIAISLGARNIGVPASLRGLGLRLSSKLFYLPAMANFLRPSPQGGQDGELGSVDASAIHETLHSILGHMHSQQAVPFGGSFQRRSEIFNLLTGRSISSGTMKPSIRAMISASNDFREAYKSYILLLGEVGAVRSIWHEWHNSTGFKSPKIDMNLILFTNAIVRSVGQMRQQPGVAAAIGIGAADYAEDAHLDGQLVALPEASGAETGFSADSRPYAVPNQKKADASGDASEGAALRAQVQNFLKTKDMKSALAILQQGLVTTPSP